MIVFSTCWYILKAKFDKDIYENWIHNFLSNVNNFKLVVYTNKQSSYMIEPYRNNPNIKIILLELEEFYNYKYQDFWIKNHQINYLLNQRISWELNMLWSEKISFVKKTKDEKYFDGNWYGWCDIGYFRCRSDDIPPIFIKHWPREDIVTKLDNRKIYYAKVNNDKEIMNDCIKNILNKNERGLPKNPIDPGQMSIAGGFFLIAHTKINWWHQNFDNKLKLYFENERLVKDDQIIILDCVVNNMSNFILVEERTNYDNWFLFQRYLL